MINKIPGEPVFYERNGTVWSDLDTHTCSTTHIGLGEKVQLSMIDKQYTIKQIPNTGCVVNYTLSKLKTCQWRCRALHVIDRGGGLSSIV